MFKPVHPHIGIGECLICGHNGRDCKGVKRPLRANEQIMLAVEKAARAQTEFWSAMRELEVLYGYDLDSASDLSTVSSASDLKRFREK